jgi:PTS system beta-glucosides-specific IIC component
LKRDYQQLAAQIISEVGGKDNIASALHCYTRLRLNLKDTGLVNIENLKALDVIGAQFSGAQLQIIIGNDINEVYEEVIKQSGVNHEKTIEENLDNPQKKKLTPKTILDAVIDGIVSCIIPILPILIGSGIIQAIVMICENAGWLSSESDTAITLTFVANSAFYFMPVIIGGFAAKKFGANIALGAMLGGVLIHPTFVQMVTDGDAGSIFGIPIYAASYSSTIFPIIISVWVMSYIEKFISKHSPKSLRTIFEPVGTLLIMTPLTLCLLAPLGAMASVGFAEFTTWFYDTFGVVAVAILCAVIPFVVMLGMHVGTVPIAVATIAANGVDYLIVPAFFISNFTQGAACLAVGIKSKDTSLRSFAFTSAFSDIVPGISEPGMYGITLRYKTPMYGAMIGAACGGLYFGLMGVGAFSFLAPNIFALTEYIGPTGYESNFINAIIGILIAFAAAFIATMILYKPKEAETQSQIS